MKNEKLRLNLLAAWIAVVDRLTGRWPRVNEWILVHTTPADY